MKYKIQLVLSFVLQVLLLSCSSPNTSETYKLTNDESRICDTLQIDETIIQDIRKFNTNKIEPFHYSLGKTYSEDKEIEVDPIHLKGLILHEQNSKSYDLVFKLKDDFRKKGYTIFLLENNFDIDEQLDNIGVPKTTDKYVVLKQIETYGINFDITNDSLITIIKQFDKRTKRLDGVC